MVKVYLIRHAESQANVACDLGLNWTECDPDLTIRGCEQAYNLKQDLGEIIFDRIYVSPLKRTQRTFKISELKCCEWQSWDLIREHKTETCDFLQGEEIIYEAETSVIGRVEEVKDYLRRHHPNETIALITHADFIWYWTAIQHDGERYGHWLGNAEWIEIKID